MSGLRVQALIIIIWMLIILYSQYKDNKPKSGHVQYTQSVLA